jgi:hypothetical protein
MFAKIVHRVVVLVFTVSVAVVTKQVSAPQMPEQLVAVHEPLVTKLAERVPPV